MRFLFLLLFISTAQAQLAPSKMVSTDASNHLTAYAGTSPAACSNQFLRQWTLSAAGVGSAACATVSLIADVTGTLPFANGGFGFSTAAVGDIFYASALNTPGKLTIGTSGKVLQSNGTIPGWSSAAFPSSAGALNTWLRSDGTNWVASTPTLANSYSAGDLVYAGSADVLSGLPVDSAGKILRSTGTLPAWSTPTFPNTATANKALVGDGTNIVLSTPTIPLTSSPSSGKVMVGDGTNWVASTPTFPNASATSGKYITSDGTNWIASTPTLPTSATSGGVLYASAANTWATSGALGSTQVVLGGGAGAAPNTNSAFTFDGTDVQIGASTPVKIRDGGIFVNVAPSALSGLQVNRTFTDAASTPGALNFYAKIAQSTASLSTGYASIVQGEFNPNTVAAVNRTITNAYANNTIAYYSGVMGAAATVGVTTLYGLAAGLGHTGASPVGTITSGQVFTANAFTKLGTGSPDVRLSRLTGVQVENMGTGAGSGGFTLTSAQGLAIANQSGASNHFNLHVGATNIPVGGSWSIYNESTYKNVHAGPSFFGGTTSPTALIHTAAGTTSASTAPFKFTLTSAALLTSAEAGALETNSTNGLFWTDSTPTRHLIAMLSGSTALTSGKIPVATTSGFLQDGPAWDGTTLTSAVTGALNGTLGATTRNTLQATTGDFNSTLKAGNSALGGVTASPWSTGNFVEVGHAGTALWDGATNSTYLTGNYYYNSGDKFAGTGYALYNALVGADGSFRWYASSASGSAAGAATMGLNMQLSASGALTLPNIGTTVSAANAFLDSGASNNLLRSTSSRVYKTNIRTFTDSYIDRLRPVRFTSLATADDPRRPFIGFIAEEVFSVDPALATVVEGKPNNVDDRALIAVLVKEVQDLRRRVGELEAANDDRYLLRASR